MAWHSLSCLLVRLTSLAISWAWLISALPAKPATSTYKKHISLLYSDPEKSVWEIYDTRCILSLIVCNHNGSFSYSLKKAVKNVSIKLCEKWSSIYLELTCRESRCSSKLFWSASWILWKCSSSSTCWMATASIWLNILWGQPIAFHLHR